MMHCNRGENMDFDGMWIIWIVIGIILFVVIVEVINFFKEFRKDIRYLEKERRRAYSEAEYEYWTKKIKRQYLRLIPFMSVIMDRKDKLKRQENKRKA